MNNDFVKFTDELIISISKISCVKQGKTYYYLPGKTLPPNGMPVLEIYTICGHLFYADGWTMEKFNDLLQGKI